jgi:hypothetical protein
VAGARVTRGSTDLALLLLCISLVTPGLTLPPAATTACTNSNRALPSGTTEGRDARALS